MSDAIRVNGNEISYGSIVLKCNGERYFGFTEVSWGQKRERGKRKGMDRSQGPRARSRGDYNTDLAKLKGPVDTLQALRTQLAAEGPDGVTYGDTEFQVEITGEEQDITFNIQMNRCVIAEETGSWSTGTEGLEEEIGIDVMTIVRDGKTLFQAEPL